MFLNTEFRHVVLLITDKYKLLINMIKKVVGFYITGFKRMTWGRTLWLIIFIKLFIMFFVLKLFFFPNLLKTGFETDEERSNHVIENLINLK